MSTLLPVVGAVGGFMIGGPSGAALGMGLGNMLAGMFGDGQTVKLPDQEGPRLTDLRVQTSCYGNVIPEIYGNIRTSGNVIWSRPLKEVKKTSTTSTTTGGKGGGGGKVTQTQTTITYHYYCTLAIAICEGEIEEVSRVWADAKELDESFLSKDIGKYNVYLGSEDQMPDSIMESYLGAGNVPAHRGMAYVVIEDFPLQIFGNRIPNFSFEIKRTVKTSGISVEEKIKDIVLIPGAGEYVYGTNIYKKQGGYYGDHGWLPNSVIEPLNMHNNQARANVLVALDEMQKTLPNLEYVSLVVCWFATSTDAGNCEIVPKVDFQIDEGEEFSHQTVVTPYDWEVAGYTRDTASVVLTLPNGNPTYGGTPTDRAIIEICQELKSRGLKVLFYPMPFVDEITPNPKPWRGRIEPSSAADVTSFFTGTNGYNNFILHYTTLSVGGVYLKDNIDTFVIGSEMVGMTSYSDVAGNYPAVNHFITLANSVKTNLGSEINVTYAADWSEYHHANGGWYNLDPLWACASIDLIGIDAYFPLTDDLEQKYITEDRIKDGWESGEGWDYYYTDSINRTGKTDFEDFKFAWKNIEWWWKNVHTNPDENQTAWTPKMKPLWFTEFGFPSVDGCANQPNVFFDPSSSESYFPRGSRGRVDFEAQREAINASIDFFQELNARTGNENLLPRAFLWTWDARPFPQWPDFIYIWQDYSMWKTGHWIQGKLGSSTLGGIVANFLKKVGLETTDFEVSRLSDNVVGFLRSQILTVRDVIEQLKSCYFFDVVESDGVLKFVKCGGEAVATIEKDELIPLSKDGNIRDVLEIVRTQELDLPKEVDITYISKSSNYDPHVAIAQRQTVKAVDKVGLNLPIALSSAKAQAIADITLYNAWAGRTSYHFLLPTKYSWLEPTDIINLNIDGAVHTIRLVTIKAERNGLLDVSGIAEDVSSYDFYTPPGDDSTTQIGQLIPETRCELIDIPALPSDTSNESIMRIAVCPLGENWNGCSIFRSDDGGDAVGGVFNLIDSTDVASTIGGVVNEVEEGTTEAFDYKNKIDVALVSGELSSKTEFEVLNGANVAVIGNEIIKFVNVELIEENLYRLSKLLRGRLGTEHEISNHSSGERFVLLDENIKSIVVDNNLGGSEKHYKAVTVGSSLDDTSEFTFTYNNKTLKPYSVCRVKGERHNPASNDWKIIWLRRTRFNGGLKDYVDIPLNEEKEVYHLEILNGSDEVLRTETEIFTSEFVYSEAKQIEDFGVVQTSVKVRIFQISAIVGRGFVKEVTLN